MSTPAAPTSRLLLVTLALLTTITAIVSSLGAPLVPAIAVQYGVPLTDAQWTLTATMLCGAVTTPIFGRLGSGRRRRPAILVGLAVVTAGTALAALSLGFAALVTGRTVQGVGLALIPLALAVARDSVPTARLSPTIAVLSVTTVAGAGLGYPVTALVAEVWGLHGAFWLGTVLTGLTLVMAVRFVPPSDGDAAQRVDWAGAGLLSVGMVALLLSVTRGDHWGWTSATTLGLAATGLVVLGAWVRWTWRAADPLVDLRLAVLPGVAGPNLTALAGGVGMYAVLTLVMVVVQADPADGWGFGQPVTVAGLMLVPYSLASVIGSRGARAFVRRLGTRALLPTGGLMFLAATVAIALVHDHLWQLAVGMALAGLGSGFTFSSLAVLMVPHVPRAETGSAMAFNQVLRYLGFSVGSALSVSLMALLGGGQDGFRGSLLILSSTWVLAGCGGVALSRRRQSSR